MRLKLISCEVLYREMCFAIARSPHQVDVEFLPKGLHDLGSEPMRHKLQGCVDGVDARQFDAVLMGYALCGNGLAGLCARTLPIVIPRAHDCIALLMGSRHKYQEYFDANPGMYFRSTGWLERGGDLEQVFRDRTGVGHTLAELVSRYGEDDGRYLYEQLTDPARHARLSRAELNYIRSDPAELSEPVPWHVLISARPVWGILLARFLTDPVWWFYLFWAPKFLNSQFGLQCGGPHTAC